MVRKAGPGVTDPRDGGADKERYELRKCEDVTSLTLDERKCRLKQIRIRYPRFKATMDLIRQAHESARGGGSPVCCYISGPPGVGKSELYAAYMHPFERRSTQEGTIIPILPFFLPIPATPRSVASRILEQLGDPNFERGTTASLSSRVAHFIRECQVELLVLDEFHHFIDRDTRHVLVTVSEWLKTLIITTGIPVAAFGMLSGERVLDYRTDPAEDESQLGSRFALRRRLTPFCWDEKEGQNEFQTFLQLFDDALPLAERSELDDPDAALRIHFATAGLTRPLKDNLLPRALELVVKGGGERIERKHLRKAFDDVIQPAHKHRRNPFSVQTFTTDIASKWAMEEKKRVRSGGSHSTGRPDLGLGDVLQG